MATGETAAHTAVSNPRIRRVGLDDPWIWLAKGWRDLWAQPAIGLGYGALVTAISILLALGLFSLQMSSVVVALAAGFFLIGPLLAVGLYETSRRLECDEPITLTSVVIVGTRSPAQLAFLGVILMASFLIWVRAATLIFALFFGAQAWPPLEQFLPTLLFTWHGLGLLVVGTVAGAVIAFAIFAASAVSVPLLMTERLDAVTAVITSFRSVIENPAPMLLWAWLVTILIGVGMVTGFLGLVVTFPLIGHATWHAYRALIEV
ncbi:MAG TPA: DUF2189 domain-containing protein [Kiloniellaceae bacterium]|nr:DUF2189 domain-containing protein [Kiloniellaceae bacterium]